MFDFFGDFFQSPAGRGDVSATSPRPAEDQGDWGDVAATSPRPAGDWKKSPKNRTCLNFPRLLGDPASLQETSRRLESSPGRRPSLGQWDRAATAGDVAATEKTSRRRPRDFRANWLSPLETFPRHRLGESASHFLVSWVARVARVTATDQSRQSRWRVVSASEIGRCDNFDYNALISTSLASCNMHFALSGRAPSLNA